MPTTSPAAKPADKGPALRASAALLLARALKALHPDAKLGTATTTEEEFAFDVLLGKPLSEDDLPAIEAKMKELVKANLNLKRDFIAKQDASNLFLGQGEDFEAELVAEMDTDAKIEVVRMGDDFTVLVKPGPQAFRTGDLKHLKLTRVSGAYWKGDATRPQMMRVYGTVWPTKEGLDTYLTRMEEARKRDHRRLGKEMELFMFHPYSPGAPFWLPKGLVVWHLLSQKMREYLIDNGYQEIRTPILYEKTLFETSGHWQNYRENMFIIKEDEHTLLAMKPMNCPSHMLVYASKTRSYRDLPIRFHDQSILHRNEVRGTLGGLTRLRQFSQDDAHLFVRPDQIEEEITNLLGMVHRVNTLFGFTYQAKLSTRPEKFMGEIELWNEAERQLENALKANNIPYTINAGDGAFYGPKIDFDLTDAIGRKWQCATIQLDFQNPLRFDLKYVAEGGEEKVPVVIHRAIYGSLERFFAILLEHYGGNLPVWLAPVQAKVLSLSAPYAPYAREVAQKLRALGFRVEADDSDQTLQSKIREAELGKVPYMLVVGGKEAETGTVSVRSRVNKSDEGTKTVDEFGAWLKERATLKY
ncbi:MAG TPA: threonine--tRNA ligase [Candidatus Thermoplasmatota archaeon]|nr:threonine--tRNA ligase [Candidatus Thermoplasmatota archaeon]